MKVAGTKLIFNTERRTEITSPFPQAGTAAFKTNSLCKGDETLRAYLNLACEVEHGLVIPN